MRKGEKFKYLNDIEAAELAKELSKLTGILPNHYRHILWLTSIGMTHLVAGRARNSDKRMEELNIEIPYVGLLVLSIDKNDNIEFKRIKLEEEFKDRLVRAVRNGESDLVKEINNKFVENIKARYEEII